MERVEGASSFQVSGDAYGAFMGRYSEQLAARFADAAGVVRGWSVLDVGCGPGALAGVLCERLGAGAVAACDPSPPFVVACGERYPGVDVRHGRAEDLPYDDDRFDAALAQLVLHFVTDPLQAVAEARRVVRPGGVVAACVWDFAEGMEMLRRFWDAALSVDADAPDEARTMRFGGEGEIAELFVSSGLENVTETTLTVTSTYRDFDELWSGFLGGIGPAGSYCVSVDEPTRATIRQRLFERIGSPSGVFTLGATARSATATLPR